MQRLKLPKALTRAFAQNKYMNIKWILMKAINRVCLVECRGHCHFCRSKRVEYKEFHTAYSNKFLSDLVFRCVSYSIITAQLFIQKV